ncbi:MAG: ABC transporter substrate-binding protein, partial [Candidatus Latescibacterota bacterium]
MPIHASEIQDDLGEAFSFSSPPMRIISLAPSNTEMLFALGVENRVVGVTEYCNYPPKADSLGKVAGFNTVNLEKVVEARPDLVLAIRGNDMESLRSLRQLGIPVFSLDVQNLDQVSSALRRLGTLLGVEQHANILADSLAYRVRLVRREREAIAEKPSVMWGFWGEPIYTAGAGTMIDDVIETAGGENVGRLAKGTWPQISLETVIEWAPEVIITTHVPGGADSLSKEVDRLRETEGWKRVPAVRSGRIYHVEGDWLLRPGPRLVHALQAVTKLLHEKE